MEHGERLAAGRLATNTLIDTVSHVECVHRAIATRAFTFTDPVSLPVRFVHDGITTAIYALIRRGALTGGLIATELFGSTGRSDRPAGSTPRSNLALAALNAILGDELADEGSPLAIPMSVRTSRADVAPQHDDLTVAFPAATPKVAVFLHGLGETEDSWRLHADRQGGKEESTYGSRLTEDFGITPVYLRYNTGLHISENGRHLNALLAAFVDAWPAGLDELLLVGHSMGGLVARSACHQAWQRGDPWVSAVRHVVYLGCPHLGAGLEQWVSRLSEALTKLQPSRPLAAVLDRRSAGIKDLHSGCLLEDDWRDSGARAKRRVHDVPLLPWAKHYTVSATVTTSRHGPLGQVVGDLLVQPESALGGTGQGRHIPFPAENICHVDGLHHFQLLNHPTVYEAIRGWLAAAPDGHPEVAPDSVKGRRARAMDAP